jgi:hypothetical protein
MEGEMVAVRRRGRIGVWFGIGLVSVLLLVGGLSTVFIKTGDPARPIPAIDSSTAPSASPPLAITSISISPNPVNAGSQFSVNAQVSGGVPPYNYNWNSIPGGCPSVGNSAGWQCTLSSAGEYSVGLSVTDSGVNHTTASQSFNVTNGNGNGNGGNGNGKNSNGNGSNGFNLSSFGPFLLYGLIAGLVAFALLVALTIGVIAIAVILARRLPRAPKGQLVCGSCKSTAPVGSKFCPACAAPFSAPKPE